MTKVQYTIDEKLAKLAHEAISFRDYKTGSATAEYERYVAEARELGEKQKQRVDARYHDKIDALVDTYARKIAKWINDSNRNRAYCPSVMVAGFANFPVSKKEKQLARDKSLHEEYERIQSLLSKIKGTGTAGVSGDDKEAIEKLTEKIARLEKTHADMKAANVYYRKHKTVEASMRNVNGTAYNARSPFEAYELSLSLAEIKRLKERVSELTAMQSADLNGWNFSKGYVEINREANRIQLIFNDKPSEEIRATLKKSGFRWSPRYSAWQRQLTTNAIRDAQTITHALDEYTEK